MTMTFIAFVEKFEQRHPRFTGSIEVHFHEGKIKDIKSHESHKDLLIPKEQKGHFTRPI